MIKTNIFTPNPPADSSFVDAADQNKISSDTFADDNIEDDEDPVVVKNDDTNKVVPAVLPGLQQSAAASQQQQQQQSLQPPTKFASFSKAAQNAVAIEQTPKFNDQFSLAAWLRRPQIADKGIKEHVLCGTDSKAMNRHHFALYFYKGNFKFLLRREPHQGGGAAASSSDASSDEVFYPSLWEWQLSEELLNDAKWHFYEVKFTYPNASLFIDGVKFVETTSNSDIIDAYELNDVSDVGSVTTYVGACYHGREIC